MCIFYGLTCFINGSISSCLLILTTNIGYNLLFWFLVALSYYIYMRSFLTSSIVMNYAEWIYSVLVRWSRLFPPSLETQVSFQWIVSKCIWLVFIDEFRYKIYIETCLSAGPTRQSRCVQWMARCYHVTVNHLLNTPYYQHSKLLIPRVLQYSGLHGKINLWTNRMIFLLTHWSRVKLRA